MQFDDPYQRINEKIGTFEKKSIRITQTLKKNSFNTKGKDELIIK